MKAEITRGSPKSNEILFWENYLINRAEKSNRWRCTIKGLGKRWNDMVLFKVQIIKLNQLKKTSKYLSLQQAYALANVYHDFEKI